MKWVYPYAPMVQIVGFLKALNSSIIWWTRCDSLLVLALIPKNAELVFDTVIRVGLADTRSYMSAKQMIIFVRWEKSLFHVPSIIVYYNVAFSPSYFRCQRPFLYVAFIRLLAYTLYVWHVTFWRDTCHCQCCYGISGKVLLVTWQDRLVIMSTKLMTS